MSILRSRTSGGGVVAPDLTADPTQAFAFTSVTAHYSADLYNGEINLRHPLFSRLNMLAGFRYLELRDTLSLDGNAGQDNATTSVTNHLYGFQLGADMVIEPFSIPIQFKPFMKAGVYGNNVSRLATTTGADVGNTSIAQSVGQFAFVGEAGLTTNYEFTKHISAFGGYQVMWIQGVAQAMDSPGAFNPLQTNQTIFVQGGEVGLLFQW
jgi:hypothetical protein